MSAFSSRGPRTGDSAIKPDIAAPGEDIVAARAAGTGMGTPLDQYYTAASGTSMATPHVAGAAAILAQQHPDWTAGQLKAGLMSAARPVDGTVYAQGAGRLDVGRAVAPAGTRRARQRQLRLPHLAGHRPPAGDEHGHRTPTTATRPRC